MLSLIDMQEHLKDKMTWKAVLKGSLQNANKKFFVSYILAFPRFFVFLIIGTLRGNKKMLYEWHVQKE